MLFLISGNITGYGFFSWINQKREPQTTQLNQLPAPEETPPAQLETTQFKSTDVSFLSESGKCIKLTKAQCQQGCDISTISEGIYFSNVDVPEEEITACVGQCCVDTYGGGGCTTVAQLAVCMADCRPVH